VIVFGDQGGRIAGGAAYDPETDEWRNLAAMDLPEDGLVRTDGMDANASNAIWDGSRLVVMDYSRRAAAYEPATDSWSLMPSMPVNTCEGYPDGASVAGATLVELCGEDVMLSSDHDRWQVVRGGELTPAWARTVVPAADVFLLVPYSEQAEGRGMYVYRPPRGEPPGTVAWDVAAAFGALRADYPFEPANVPLAIEQEIGTLVSANARAQWDDPASGLGRFWAYYPGFEVRSVERASDGTFEARVRFTRYSGSDAYDEILTIAPGGPGSTVDPTIW
jgi:hypothetical protein